MLPFGTYPGRATNVQPFISCNRVHDVEISGWGRIDGQGAAWWAAYLSKTNTSLVRPMMLNLSSCNRLFIHDVTFANPPFHHCGLRGDGGNITISNLTVDTVFPSPNTDGLNFVGTNSIIENCRISDGDDNIAMGFSGPINDLLITNCVFGSGHGVSIGSGITSGISNLTVAGCIFDGTENGIRIKCNEGRSAPIRDLNYFNLSMTNVNMPIVIYSYYNLVGNPRKITPRRVLAASNAAPITATTPVWRDITISNLVVSSSRGEIAGIIWGPAEMPISNVTLVDITNDVPGTFDLYNVRGVKIIDSEFNFADGNALILCNAGVAISNSVPRGREVKVGADEGDNSLALYNVSASVGGADSVHLNPVTVSGGALKVGQDLTLPISSVQNFYPGTNPGTIEVTGDLALDGTINIIEGDGFAATNYTLFNYTGGLSGRPVLGTTPAGYTCSLDTNSPGKVILVVSH